MRRWYGIRHLRSFWHAIQLARWVGFWSTYGDTHASPADLDYLDAIWEGRL